MFSSETYQEQCLGSFRGVFAHSYHYGRCWPGVHLLALLGKWRESWKRTGIWVLALKQVIRYYTLQHCVCSVYVLNPVKAMGSVALGTDTQPMLGWGHCSLPSTARGHKERCLFSSVFIIRAEALSRIPCPPISDRLSSNENTNLNDKVVKYANRMSDMIKKEDNSGVIAHGEETAESVVKMDNMLKEAAEPKQNEKVYTAQQKWNVGASAGSFTMSTPVTMGGLECLLGKSPSKWFWETPRDTCDFTTLCCIRFPGTLIFSWTSI